MEPKKISFGFSKITKKPALLPPKNVERVENQVELIKCLEGQQIQLIEERKEEAPIVIPLKENGKTSSALASLMKRRAVLLGIEDEPEVVETLEKLNKPQNGNAIDTAVINTADDLEKRATQEILADLKANIDAPESSSLVLPILKPDELPLDGAKESTLNDYESIPIEQYGFAMLRGMGWVEPPASKQKGPVDDGPTVRPKGMGLGADKALKSKPLLVAPEANEILEIKKNAFVRILGGKFKDSYGQIEGFDDDKGRVIVKLAIGGSKEAFNEFLCQPISKKEYAQYGKCINTTKYEQYKKLENEHGQIIIKKEEKPTKPEAPKIEKHEAEYSRSESNRVEKNLQPKYETSKPRDNYKEEYDRQRSSRGRHRTRSRSPVRHDKSTSKKRHQRASSSDDKSGTSTSDSDADSAYEQRQRHHKKSKSHRHKSKSSKKKHRHHSRSDSNSSKDSSDDAKQRHKHKKNKKKTKKSKKQRSRTPSRHRK